MSVVYFIVLKSDLTQNIVDKHVGGSDLYKLRTSADQLSIVMKFDSENIPYELFKGGYSPMTESEMSAHLSDPGSGYEAAALGA